MLFLPLCSAHTSNSEDQGEFLKYTFSPGVGMFEAGVLDNLICANRYQHCWGEGGAPG